MSSLGSIGQELKEARQNRGLSLEETAAATHIPLRHLVGLEEGHAEGLHEPFYVKSFIRKYANFLGLPGEEMAERYWAERPQPQPEPAQSDNSVWWMFPLLASLALLFAIGIAWQFSLSSKGAKPQAPPSAVSLASKRPSLPIALPPATASKKATVSYGPATSSAAPVKEKNQKSSFPLTPPATASKKATVSLEPSTSSVPVKGKKLSLAVDTVDACWVHVVADGVVVQHSLVPAGKKIFFSADRSLSLRLGNAGGALLTFNGEYLGALGEKGKVMERTFKVNE